ncbi:protein-methionine-sulfoxide reductase catalytic subunit MsrP [Chelatococcus sambhunathii]|uniref:Protein-methionine-sulfoxide reductase catalytic subunit MsrP n=1 Tax=Chelatococcus sambhunathii TaxID=363953 RepID=A0ABU1DGF4_9HYPH|nr:protein-methionine-sulfoxide reductase catalytic subunit MsrP [Chelatococcus sambhunathii]MDR4307084.1 protein-methionine-sulfoxide reductase catalytic subunit MsrP [Chelatococcus sambhunathii]
MLIRRTPSWALPESAATPEHVAMNRRRFMAAGAGLAAGAFAAPGAAEAGLLDIFKSKQPPAPEGPDPSAGLYPAKRNPAFKLDRDVTPEKINLAYNNYYEFGTNKWDPAENAGALRLRPWTVKIGGLVETPREVGIDDLLKALPLEERLYRHRCVEAWSMALPWTGIPMKDFVAWAKPLGSAKYVVMKTFLDTAVAPYQASPLYEWPYTEGLTIQEATNELAFLATGAYGKPLAKQMGAPIRLAVPWKYGFKSVKSIVSFEFSEKRPKTLWQAAGPSEYGFWANVNPEVSHPRWSQAQERVLGTNDRRPTQLYNGYAEQVASLYKGLEGEKLFM